MSKQENVGLEINLFWFFNLVGFLLGTASIVALYSQVAAGASWVPIIQQGIQYWDKVLQVLLGWTEPYLNFLIDLAGRRFGYEFELHEYWRQYLVLTLILAKGKPAPVMRKEIVRRHNLAFERDHTLNPVEWVDDKEELLHRRIRRRERLQVLSGLAQLMFWSSFAVLLGLLPSDPVYLLGACGFVALLGFRRIRKASQLKKALSQKEFGEKFKFNREARVEVEERRARNLQSSGWIIVGGFIGAFVLVVTNVGLQLLGF